MISSIGLRSLVESKPDFFAEPQFVIVAVIFLVTGLGMPAIRYGYREHLRPVRGYAGGRASNVILPQREKGRGEKLTVFICER